MKCLIIFLFHSPPFSVFCLPYSLTPPPALFFLSLSLFSIPTPSPFFSFSSSTLPYFTHFPSSRPFCPILYSPLLSSPLLSYNLLPSPLAHFLPFPISSIPLLFCPLPLYLIFSPLPCPFLSHSSLPSSPFLSLPLFSLPLFSLRSTLTLESLCEMGLNSKKAMVNVEKVAEKAAKEFGKSILLCIISFCSVLLCLSLMYCTEMCCALLQINITNVV